MGLLSHRVERSEMKPGDHIYTWRAGYTYHGTTRLLLLWSLSVSSLIPLSSISPSQSGRGGRLNNG
jgi:hypothetical protein